jgi:hypothetical protein
VAPRASLPRPIAPCGADPVGRPDVPPDPTSVKRRSKVSIENRKEILSLPLTSPRQSGNHPVGEPTVYRDFERVIREP